MPMKGTLKPDHISKNSYEFKVVGIVPLTIVSTSSLEEETKTVDLPDNTKASGGETNPGEFTFSVPMHHKVEEAALESWLLEGQGPVSPTYKKPATIIYGSISGNTKRSYALEGCWLTKRTLPENEMSDDGEMQMTEWTCSYDKIYPIV